MAWRDELRPASFRGVSFKVDSGEQGGGRRTVTHEYPLRDQPYVEDMGMKARTFTMEGYVIGDDYMVRRDALMTALEGAGPGQLIHPYLGTKQVICSSFSVRESTQDGRMARFTMTLEEASQPAQFPAALQDYSSLVGSAADASLLSIASSFLGAYDTGFQPQFSLDSLVVIIQDFSTMWTRLFGKRVTEVQPTAIVHNRLDQVYADAPTIVRSPQLAVSTVTEVTQLISQYMPSRQAALETMQEAYTFSSGEDPPVVTATRQLEIDNRMALFALVKQTVATEAARAAVDTEYDSYDAAIAGRDSVTEMIDEQTETSTDDVYDALSELRKEVVRGIPGEEKDLPRILDYSPVVTVPSLVLSHKLYGDISKEADLIARNNIRHPGFVPGGRTLEVLSDA